MLIRIANVLDEPGLEAVRSTLDTLLCSRMTDALTAGWHAREVKRNLQATSDDLTRGRVAQAQAGIAASRGARRGGPAKRLVRLLISRYEPGMIYGMHVDDALIGGGSHRSLIDALSVGS